MKRWLRLAGAVAHPRRMGLATRALFGTTVRAPAAHAGVACDWLLQAQRAGGGGHAHSFDLIDGWLPPYPETTGYIIPTLLDAAQVLRRPDLHDAALQAGHWLLQQQRPDGAFGDLAGQPQVFDTGQILLGLLALQCGAPAPAWEGAIVRAAEFLLGVQDADGAWRRHAFQGIAHTYYSRVAAALIAAGQCCGRDDWMVAGRRQLDWTLSRQSATGYFADMAFAADQAPFLHTIVYVLEGLEHGYRLLGERRYLDALLASVRALLLVAQRDFILRSQYAADWSVVNPEKCTTGLAQWAGLLGRLADLADGDLRGLSRAELRQERDKTLHWLLAKQLQEAPAEMRGAWTGSLPFWGRYTRFACNNWTVKFALDALLPLIGTVSAADLECAYISSAFQAQAQRHYVPEQVHLEPAYIAFIGAVLQRQRPGHLVDIGCGHGHLLAHLLQQHPQWRGSGVEPSFIPAGQQQPVIVAGNAYQTHLPDGCADVILLKEVLQHVGDLPQALREVQRIARPGARLLIIERDPVNLFGLLKPLRELAGRWMYPWDSSFRERWFSARQWRQMLAPYGQVRQVTAVNPRYPGSPWRRLDFGFLLIELELP